MDDFAVVVSAGTLRQTGGVEGAEGTEVHLPHRWTPEGVLVRTAFTGAHLLHLAVAGCVLNDLYREAARLGLPLAGVRVSADGAFDTGTWRSTGIAYAVELDCAAPREQQEALLAAVDAVAEVPRALRLGGPVTRVAPGPTGR